MLCSSHEHRPNSFKQGENFSKNLNVSMLKVEIVCRRPSRHMNSYTLSQSSPKDWLLPEEPLVVALNSQSSAEEGWSPPVTVPTQMRHSIKLAKFEQKWTNASDSLGKISHLFCLPCFFFLDFINCTDSRGHEESDPCVAKWLLDFLSRLAGSQRPVYKIR